VPRVVLLLVCLLTTGGEAWRFVVLPCLRAIPLRCMLARPIGGTAMRRAVLHLSVLLLGMLAGAALTVSQSRLAAPLAPGTVVEVHRPDGIVTDAEGNGAAPLVRHHRLRVARVGGPEKGAGPLGNEVWVFVVGDGPAVYLVPVEE